MFHDKEFKIYVLYNYDNEEKHYYVINTAPICVTIIYGTLTQCWINAGQASLTLDQHWFSIGSTSYVWCVMICTRSPNPIPSPDYRKNNYFYNHCDRKSIKSMINLLGLKYLQWYIYINWLFSNTNIIKNQPIFLSSVVLMYMLSCSTQLGDIFRLLDLKPLSYYHDYVKLYFGRLTVISDQV